MLVDRDGDTTGTAGVDERLQRDGVLRGLGVRNAAGRSRQANGVAFLATMIEFANQVGKNQIRLVSRNDFVSKVFTPLRR